MNTKLTEISTNLFMIDENEDPCRLPEHLRSCRGRYHSFQFPIEPFDRDGEIHDLWEAEDLGTGGIHDLIECAGDEFRVDAVQAVAAWLETGASAILAGELVR